MKESIQQHAVQFEWAVIGAGPAGMATVGRLIDAGVNGKSIAWIDPHFTVGDFGAKWHSVSSNTRVGLFVKFLHECKSFHYDQCDKKFALHEMDPLKTCELSSMADPLQWVTDQLREQVVCLQEHASALNSHKSLAHARVWDIALESSLITSHNVVLALGSQPKSLNLGGVKEVSVTDALNAQRLSQCVLPSDTVAVFGASHSAVLIIRLLLENCKVKRVVNFYKSPLRYAEYLDGWIRHDDTGLKGTTAQWARENIDVNCPRNLDRVLSTPENHAKHLPECTKAVYAVGFTPRQISVDGVSDLKHNPQNGVIAPGLFGVGIAFPEARANRDGVVEHRVGLWKFMEYLGEVVPLWLAHKT